MHSPKLLQLYSILIMLLFYFSPFWYYTKFSKILLISYFKYVLIILIIKSRGFHTITYILTTVRNRAKYNILSISYILLFYLYFYNLLPGFYTYIQCKQYGHHVFPVKGLCVKMENTGHSPYMGGHEPTKYEKPICIQIVIWNTDKLFFCFSGREIKGIGRCTHRK